MVGCLGGRFKEELSWACLYTLTLWSPACLGVVVRKKRFLFLWLNLIELKVARAFCQEQSITTHESLKSRWPYVFMWSSMAESVSMMDKVEDVEHWAHLFLLEMSNKMFFFLLLKYLNMNSNKVIQYVSKPIYKTIIKVQSMSDLSLIIPSCQGCFRGNSNVNIICNIIIV